MLPFAFIIPFPLTQRPLASPSGSVTRRGIRRHWLFIAITGGASLTASTCEGWSAPYGTNAAMALIRLLSAVLEVPATVVVGPVAATMLPLPLKVAAARDDQRRPASAR